MKKKIYRRIFVNKYFNCLWKFLSREQLIYVYIYIYLIFYNKIKYFLCLIEICIIHIKNQI